jgi:hypothetical protein
LSLGLVLGLSGAPAAAATRYVISYVKGSTAARAAAQSAGGAVVADYPAIGVLIAESANPAFRQALLADPNIEQASADLLVQWIPEMNVQASRLQALDAPNPAPQSNPFGAFSCLISGTSSSPRPTWPGRSPWEARR